MPEIKKPAPLVWDAIGEKLYETGVKKGVLFPMVNGTYGEGVAWSGLSAVNESPSGAEPTKVYADDINYLTMFSAEEYSYTIEAYQSPVEFDECDGTAEVAPGVTIRQQERKQFGFSYVTTLGNDTEGNDYGYIIHLVYNGKASPSEKSHSSVNESPEASTLSWSVSTTPVNVKGYKPTSVMEINSTTVDADKLAAFEKILYGSETAASKLMSIDEIIEFFGGTSDNADNESGIGTV